MPLGRIDPFEESNEDWPSYVERLVCYFVVNNVEENKQAPAIVSLMGKTAYKTLKQLAAPRNVAELNFATINRLLTEHYSPKSSVISERFRFYKRDQKDTESVTQYIAELKGLTVHCEFKGFLEEALRDRLVCGLKSELIQKALLTKRDLTYEMAVELSLSMEAAAIDTKEINVNTKEKVSINKISSFRQRWRGKQKVKRDNVHKNCKSCGGSNHEHESCWYKDELCRKCKRKGHIERVCRERDIDKPKRETYDRDRNKSRNRHSGKLHYMESSVQYLGHTIDNDGLHTSKDKIDAIINAPVPKDLTQLRSFIGLLSYYSRFLPNLAMILHPLYELQQKNKRWKWSSSCQQAFETAKQLISSAKVMVHYSLDLPIRLACDASPYGIGCVISHVTEQGEERPIAFASRSLSKAERNYAQIEREALSIIYGVKKFHNYLFGRSFVLYTDHKPLVTIFGPKTNIPNIAAQRLQRWALFLAGHDYSIEYRNTTQHSNADCLSRLPLLIDVPEVRQEADIFSLSEIETLPITAQQIATETRKDKVLSRVLFCTKNGWNLKLDQDIKPFFNWRDQLSINHGCLMLGVRVLIPKKFQDQILSELHNGHVGMVKMKSLARSFVFWPNINDEIESLVKSCSDCQSIQKSPAPAPLHPWAFPDRKWQRVHIDYAGPFLSKMFLVIIDAYSKWAEVFITESTTTDVTIGFLRETFARFGLPEQLISDNGTQFVSQEFNTFMKTNGIRHIRTAPYHPATNGQAERFVGCLKQGLKPNSTKMSLKKNLANFLLTYRNVQHSTTSESPAKLFLGSQIRTRLDLVLPSHKHTVIDKQTDSVLFRQSTKQPRNKDFKEGDEVMIRNYTGGQKWISGKIQKKLGLLSYIVDTPNRLHRRHVEQIVPATHTQYTPQEQLLESPNIPNITHNDNPDNINIQNSQNDSQPQTRYPTRDRKPVKRLNV